MVDEEADNGQPTIEQCLNWCDLMRLDPHIGGAIQELQSFKPVALATVVQYLRTEAARAAKPIKLTLEQVNDALNHASEGRTNSVKPDLLANQINRLIVRASAPAKEGKE